jgi:hypothetical protein
MRTEPGVLFLSEEDFFQIDKLITSKNASNLNINLMSVCRQGNYSAGGFEHLFTSGANQSVRGPDAASYAIEHLHSRPNCRYR